MLLPFKNKLNINSYALNTQFMANIKRFTESKNFSVYHLLSPNTRKKMKSTKNR